MTLKLANTIKKLSTTPKTYNILQDNVNPKPTAPPQLHHLHINQPLALATRIYRNTLAVTEHTSQGHSYPESPVSHLVLHQSKIDDAYVQMVEQPHTSNFRSQNNHFLAHDEPTDWNAQPLPFLPIQPSTPILSQFPFRPDFFSPTHFYN